MRLTPLALLVLLAPTVLAQGANETDGCAIADVSTCTARLVVEARPGACADGACALEVHATGRGMDKAATPLSRVAVAAASDGALPVEVCHAFGKKEGAFCAGIRAVSWPLVDGCVVGVVGARYDRTPGVPEAGTATAAVRIRACQDAGGVLRVASLAPA